jgi:hypothetical protein
VNADTATTTRTSFPARVAGLEPDAGGGSNAPAASAPVSKSLRTKAVSDAAGAFLIPATVGAAVGVALVLRGVLTVDGRFVLVLVLLGALLAGSIGVGIVGRRS